MVALSLHGIPRLQACFDTFDLRYLYWKNFSLIFFLLLFLVCGGEMSITEHGTIKSPGSPGNYPPNRDCIWKLTAPPSKRIQLHFFTMQLEAHETCQYDYLAVRIST